MLRMEYDVACEVVVDAGGQQGEEGQEKQEDYLDSGDHYIM